MNSILLCCLEQHFSVSALAFPSASSNNTSHTGCNLLLQIQRSAQKSCHKWHKTETTSTKLLQTFRVLLPTGHTKFLATSSTSEKHFGITKIGEMLCSEMTSFERSWTLKNFQLASHFVKRQIPMFTLFYPWTIKFLMSVLCLFGGGGFFLACDDFGGRFDNSSPA